ncbi:hypothetical protein CVT26_008182 [Gymnopilus dilepis]|uniref:F-box domain-containing protein n=1 Tax=Gymnopilus dilepis TaxID=231916 RepID=A0A409XX43_9AGAR|nr:hypothetical protein CVT26_008182 [Gymnopilus dilepis]
MTRAAKGRLQWHDTFTVNAPKRSDASNKSARKLPDLPVEIWLEIFQFSTYVHHNATIKPLDPFTPKRTTTNALGANTPLSAMRTKLALVLVCRSWRHIAQQMLYEHLVIRSPVRASIILNALRSSRLPNEPEVGDSKLRLGYGQFVRHIEVFTYARGSGELSFLQTVFQILSCCPNLRTLSGNWRHRLPPEFLDATSRLLGSSLSEFYWNERDISADLKNGTKTPPSFLGSFKALRVLDLRHFVGTDPSSWTQSSSPTLPHVRDLILSTSPSSLQIASHLSLPCLRNLFLRTPGWGDTHEPSLISFLKVHGPSLAVVDLSTPSQDTEPDPDSSVLGRTASHIPPDIFLGPGVCPNLETLVFPVTSPTLAPHTHNRLHRIGLRGGNTEGLYPDKVTSMRNHLMSINIEKYPKLELVQTVGFLVEAHTDSLIKDIFIWWVERFEAMGVDFLDGEGVLWTYTDPPEDESPKKGDPDAVQPSTELKAVLVNDNKEHP